MSAATPIFFGLLARAERSHVPLSAVVELTHACNLRCTMCYLDLLPDHRIGALSTDEWKRVFSELADAGCLVLSLTGGEPLLRRDFFELASHARSLGFALRIYTNATRIDGDCADRIAALHPLGVEVSLHGDNPRTQDAISGMVGSFERALAGVRRLRARGIKVLLKCVVGRDNYREVAGIEAIANDLGCDVLFDAEITPKNDGDESPLARQVDERDLEAVAAAIWAKKSGCAHGERVGIEERLADAPCAAGRRTVHVDPTGKIFPCTQWPTPVGDLRTQRFAEVWSNDARLRELRDKTIGDLPGCASCDLVTACNPCMALSLLEEGNLDGPSRTKCRTAPARARLVGVEGSARGPSLRGSTSGAASALVQLRIPHRP